MTEGHWKGGFMLLLMPYTSVWRSNRGLSFPVLLIHTMANPINAKLIPTAKSNNRDKTSLHSYCNNLEWSDFLLMVPI